MTLHERASAERRPEKAEEDRLELEVFQANLVALRTRDIPGYFESDEGDKFTATRDTGSQVLIAMERDKLTRDRC